MVIKVYVAMITCSQEIKKNQQRTIMILDSKNIPYIAIDITDPGCEESKEYMVTTAQPKEGSKIPITPQIFNEADYCGDYDGLDMANECDTLGDFLGLNDTEKANVKIGITGIRPEERELSAKNSQNATTEETTSEVVNTSAEESKPVESVEEVEESKAITEDIPVDTSETTEVAPEPTPPVSEDVPEPTLPVSEDAPEPTQSVPEDESPAQVEVLPVDEEETSSEEARKKQVLEESTNNKQEENLPNKEETTQREENLPNSEESPQQEEAIRESTATQEIADTNVEE